MVKNVQIRRPITFEPTDAVAQLLERPVCVRVFDPQSSHTKDFKNGISCSFVCAQHWESGTGRSGVSIL